jgi:hypothetical protein
MPGPVRKLTRVSPMRRDNLIYALIETLAIVCPAHPF